MNTFLIYKLINISAIFEIKYIIIIKYKIEKYIFQYTNLILDFLIVNIKLSCH